jgi:hypothetical protein
MQSSSSSFGRGVFYVATVLIGREKGVFYVAMRITELSKSGNINPAR